MATKIKQRKPKEKDRPLVVDGIKIIRANNYIDGQKARRTFEDGRMKAWFDQGVCAGKLYMQDMFCIALHRMGLGWGEKMFRRLSPILGAVIKEYADEAIYDDITGQMLGVAEYKCDKELKQALGNCFVEWEERYYTPMDIIPGIKAVEMTVAKETQEAVKAYKEEYEKEKASCTTSESSSGC